MYEDTPIQRRAIRLPDVLEKLCASLPDDVQRDTVRDALVDALVDAEVAVRSARFDSVVAVGYSFWAVPYPQASVLAERLATAAAVGIVDSKAVGFAAVLSALVFQILASFRARADLSSEQAIVLRTLKKAPKGEGWSLGDVVARLPHDLQLTEDNVEATVAELRSLLDATGKPVAWTVHQRDGRFWTSDI